MTLLSQTDVDKAVNRRLMELLVEDAMTGPDLIDDTAPEEPDSDPRDDHVGESGLGDADPTGPEDHPGVPE